MVLIFGDFIKLNTYIYSQGGKKLRGFTKLCAVADNQTYPVRFLYVYIAKVTIFNYRQRPYFLTPSERQKFRK